MSSGKPYEFIMSLTDKLGKYVGKWIAVVDDKIVAEGDNAREVYEEARRRYPNRELFIMKVPREAVMLL